MGSVKAEIGDFSFNSTSREEYSLLSQNLSRLHLSVKKCRNKPMKVINIQKKSIEECH